jgi:hypothetical protein
MTCVQCFLYNESSPPPKNITYSFQPTKMHLQNIIFTLSVFSLAVVSSAPVGTDNDDISEHSENESSSEGIFFLAYIYSCTGARYRDNGGCDQR